MILLSPTDRALLDYLGKLAISSSTPEEYGVDALSFIQRDDGYLVSWGIQRKAFPQDFFASIRDGRLARELTLMHKLTYRVLVVEGDMEFTADGHLWAAFYSRYTKSQIRNMLRSVWLSGVFIERTSSVQDTANFVVETDSYFRDPVHRSLFSRSKSPALDGWGMRTEQGMAEFMLQGLPGIGVTLACEIVSYFKRIPLRWDCTLDDLKLVPGIGDKKASVLWKVFGREVTDEGIDDDESCHY